MGLLDQLEDILGSDPLIDEVGFIHPSQFVALNEEAGGSLPSSAGTILQSGDVVPRLRVSELNSSETGFWCRDHKLGISTQVLLPLYNAAKQVFIAALERYKMYSSIPMMKDESGGNGMSNCFPSSLGILENEVMKHSRALLLLSCDFRTAWNSRKRILSNKQHLQIFVDELFLSALVLSYAPKSECSWSQRRWVIKTIAGKCSNLQEIVDRESELVKKIAEKSKMNYRAWNHGCWLVSYMSRGQVLQELNKSRDWTGLHIADSSCFHYRSRLMLRMLEELWYELNPTLATGYCAELRQVWKEELDWNEMLIKRYIGREALWLHRRFLSLGWIKHFATPVHDHKDTKSHEIGMFIDNELGLFRSCLVIPDDDFEDFQAHAIFSVTYILWLAKQISENLQIEFREDLLVGELKPVISKLCPEKTFLLYSFRGTNGDL